MYGLTAFFQTIRGDLVDNSTTSFTASKRLLHVMVRSSLLQIIYRRMPIQEEYLRIKYYENVPYVVFKRKLKNVKDLVISSYCQWLTGIADALRRNYVSILHDVKLKNILSQSFYICNIYCDLRFYCSKN